MTLLTAPSRVLLLFLALIPALAGVTLADCSTCCSGRVGDANGSGSDEPTIGDVSALIDAKFIAMSADPIGCLAEADINRSAADFPCTVTFEDITIGDISYLIDYLFVTGTSLGLGDCEASTPSLTYPVVDTDQELCYDNADAIPSPAQGGAFYGQDAQIDGNQMSYTLSQDGLTVYDNVTGLTWTQTADLNHDGSIDYDDKLSFADALDYPDVLNAAVYGGYDDWRLPSMKELYSLMNFSGTDPSGPGSINPIPFIDTDYFGFDYGDESAGERVIDAQFWSTNAYVSTVFEDQAATFGLNLADGRIKGYPTNGPVVKLNYVYFVRGNTNYGINDFTDNGDGTVSDAATGLMWTQDDFGDGVSNGPRSGMDWEDALALAAQKNSENYLGHSDWRLPNAKELQSLLDYSRAPDVTSSAAIDPIFNCTQITNEEGAIDYPWYWTSTTHVRAGGAGVAAAYLCFGRAMGYMNYQWMDVHGAGAQRSDQKTSDYTGLIYVSDGYYFSQSPQGDAVRALDYVRLVRDDDGSAPTSSTTEATLFAPMSSTTTYLIDQNGDELHTWSGSNPTGMAVYMLDDYSLLRTVSLTDNATFGGTGGATGRVERFDWDGSQLWEFDYSDGAHMLHHDIQHLPNGNVLMISWEYKSSTEATDAGRDPSLLVDGELWPDMIIEVEPDGTSGGNIVWEWHVWDHLIQDYSASKSNYGVVADHPEKINLNFVLNRPGADWNHFNAVDYNESLDQILITVHNFSEVWIIDHNTTTVEAAGSAGDLLYRWGNPQAYGRGSSSDQQLFVPHDGRWIAAGRPSAGDITIFNNGQNRPDGNYSSIEQITPPEDGSGGYDFLGTGLSYGPEAPDWTYVSDPSSDFFAQNISGAERLPDGNTLICVGPSGYFFEVTTDGTTVWDYTNPYSSGPAGNSVFRANRYWIESSRL